MKIEDAIHQKKFANAHHKAILNLFYTSGSITSRNSKALKPFNISQQQFNILRILRGMHPEKATVKLLTERMLDKMSNASRLVDKLKQKGLVERLPCEADRRRVDISITEKGLELVKEASKAVEADLNVISNYLTDAEAEMLSNLLDKMRSYEEE